MTGTIVANHLQNLERFRDGSASNIAKAGAMAGKGTRSFYVAQVGGDGKSIGSALVTTQTVNIQGLGYKTTDVASDLALKDPNSMFVYQNDSGQVVFGRGGPLRVSDSGNVLRTLEGLQVMGWKLDKAGKLPAESTTFGSLVPINFNLALGAKPTTEVSFGANFASNQDLIKGVGDIVDFGGGGVTSVSNPNQIIYPNTGSKGEFNIGDRFKLQLPEEDESIFEYGGFVMSKQASGGTGAILTATSAKGEFNILTDPAAARPADGLKEGDTLTITVGGQDYSFKATKQAGAASTMQFNSLASLAEAINFTDELIARVVDDRLYIGSKDSNQGITFGDDIAGRLVTDLGLDDLAAQDVAATGVTRFSTVQELSDKINADQTKGYIASVTDAGKLDFRAKSALNAMGVTGDCRNIRTASRITVGHELAGNHGTWNQTNLLTVHSNNHMLEKGDWVRLEDVTTTVADSLQDGMFQVLYKGTDYFVIGAGANQVSAIDANARAADAETFTWQKVVGRTTTFAGDDTTEADTQTDVNECRFTNLVGLTNNVLNIEKIVAGDIVHIVGAAAIRDGYYRVTGAPAANSLNVVITGGAVGAGADNAQAAAAAIQEGDGLRITKVASAGGVAADARLDTFPIEIIAASDVVRIHVTDLNDAIIESRYNVGDLFTFNDLDGVNGVVEFSGIKLTEGEYYEIKEVNRAGGYITFKAPLSDGVVAAGVAAGFIGHKNTVAAGGAVAAADGTILGDNAYINMVSREFAAMGMNKTKKEQFELAAAYDPVNSDKNFSGGKITENVFDIPLEVKNSLGKEVVLMLKAGRVDALKWRIEICGTQDKKTGLYSVVPTQDGNAGQIANGEIEFDGNGKLIRVPEALQKITVQWNDDEGAAPSEIKINWGAIDGKLDGKNADGVVRQDHNENGSTYNFVNADGHKLGNVNRVEYSEDGKVTIFYDSGDSFDAYQLATVIFANINDVKEVPGGYVASNKSGKPIIRVPTGEVLSKVIENSNINEHQEIIDMMNNVHQTGVAAAALQRMEKADDSLINRI